jgi:hypothetical protein
MSSFDQDLIPGECFLSSASPTMRRFHLRKSLILAFLITFTPMASGQNWFNGSFEQALAQAAKEKKLLLIDFSFDT